MKSTKTVLAVAIVIAGFAYVVGAGHPTYSDSLKHRCCEQPTWEYWSGTVAASSNPIGGAGLLHGVWIMPVSGIGTTSVVLWDGDPDDGGVQISVARITLREGGAMGAQFVQLDVAFENMSDEQASELMRRLREEMAS